MLSLISPIGSDFMKDFPGQNVVNLDRIDAFANACLTNDTMQQYTPGLNATTTDPVLGTGGFIRGLYYVIFDQVYVWAEFGFGTSGFSAGSGTYTMTLPFEMDLTNISPTNTTMGSSNVIGNGTAWDNDTTAGRQPLIVIPRTSTTVHFGNHNNIGAGSGRAVDHTGPVTWAASDGITWCGRYKRLASV